MIALSRLCAGVMRRMPAYAAALAIVAILAASPAASAQIAIGGDSSSGSVPGFAGTGLSGIYYNFGFTEDPLATFTSTNLCYPTCFPVNPYDSGQGGSVFDDTTGGLLGFTNGRIDNVVFNPNLTPPDTWTDSNLAFNGYIAITQPGTYLFSLGSDDYSNLTIAGQQILNIPYPPCCETRTRDVTFDTAGLYAIALGYGEYDTGSFLSLIVTTDDRNLPSACLFGCVDENGNVAANGLFYSDGQFDGAPAPTIGGGWSGIAALALVGGGAALRRYRRGAVAQQA